MFDHVSPILMMNISIDFACIIKPLRWWYRESMVFVTFHHVSHVSRWKSTNQLGTASIEKNARLLLDFSRSPRHDRPDDGQMGHGHLMSIRSMAQLLSPNICHHQKPPVLLAFFPIHTDPKNGKNMVRLPLCVPIKITAKKGKVTSSSGASHREEESPWNGLFHL